ncbi:hypothetical protein BT96DRAFT_939078 [Gymnopus androsaceus JB14]|uniref:Uncharacterized protein n=1 Tax=Gymnopus androsaceus JB14 TaxID=1447944 RepID=A0A6A4HQ95_9AGAR|nr:hypothetical protein BT96DRAFT_939078 [Gymnopus androsaceus JB14]
MEEVGSDNPSHRSEKPFKLDHSALNNMSLDSGSAALLDDQDEDVRIAVQSLGRYEKWKHWSRSRNQRTQFLLLTQSIGVATSTPTPALSISASSIPATSVPSPTLSSPSALPNHEVQVEPDFVSRMSHIPLVNGALRMYEQGKASSRVVKYGAEIMESGVKTISRPVIERLPTGQLDDFACRQLDRFASRTLFLFCDLPEAPIILPTVTSFIHTEILTDQREFCLLPPKSESVCFFHRVAQY